jgi:hypothetical protein
MQAAHRAILIVQLKKRGAQLMVDKEVAHLLALCLLLLDQLVGLLLPLAQLMRPKACS